jgi:hypothetical protein
VFLIPTVESGTEKSHTCLYGQVQGSQMHHKRAISLPKKRFHAIVELQLDWKCNFESVYAWRKNILITKIGGAADFYLFFLTSAGTSIKL